MSTCLCSLVSMVDFTLPYLNDAGGDMTGDRSCFIAPLSPLSPASFVAVMKPRMVWYAEAGLSRLLLETGHITSAIDDDTECQQHSFKGHFPEQLV